MTLRVLHVIPSLAACRGGPGVAAIEMVKALNKCGTNAEIATTNDNCEQLLEVETGTLIEYQHAPTRFFKRLSTPLKAVREFQISTGFSAWLRQNIDRYDILHVHSLFSWCSSYAMWLARRRRIPYVVHPIGQLEHWPLQQARSKKQIYLKLLERRNIERASCIHFTADSECLQARDAVRFQQHRVIPLGIDAPMQIRDAAVKLRQHYQLDQVSPVIVFLSRIHPKKGLELLLGALAQHPATVQLLIAGDGDPDYIQQLQQLVRDLELPDQCVKFIGFVQGTEKNLVLQGADLFALTSHSENFGIAVLEALAAGTPALLTRPVALSDAVQNAGLGYVADTSIESVLACLGDALSDIENAVSYSRRARNYVAQNHQWPAIGKQLQAMYQDLCTHTNG